MFPEGAKMRRSLPRAMTLSAVVGLATFGHGIPANATLGDYTFPASATPVAAIAQSIRADAAYAAGITGKGVGVALIDTGVVPVRGLTSGNIVNGPDLSLESQVPSLLHKDGYGHGTHMAGIIAGRDNTTGTGFRGIAPDAKLTSIKVAMSNGAVDITQVVAAIDWVVKHRKDDPTNPIRVINLSYGTDAAADPIVNPLAIAVDNATKAGIVVVVAAGNTGKNITVPATAVSPIVVGSVDPNGTTNPADDTVSPFSSKGGRAVIPVDVLAPGRSVVSLRDPGSYADTVNPTARVETRFFKGSGTSQAAAVVSGAIALYLQKYPSATTNQVRAAVRGGTSTVTGQSAASEINVRAMLNTTSSTTVSQTRVGTPTFQSIRGSSLVHFGDNTALTGERDIFGPVSATAWQKASAAGTSWNGGAWMGHTYTGTGWTTATNGQTNWAGTTWSGRAWSGRAWSDIAWSGRAWSGSTWSGANLTGTSLWSGRAWSGSSWA